MARANDESSGLMRETSVLSFDSSRNIARLLWEAADLVPERVAVVERESSVDHAGMRARSAGFGTALECTGIACNDRVAVLLERGGTQPQRFLGRPRSARSPSMSTRPCAPGKSSISSNTRALAAC